MATHTPISDVLRREAAATDSEIPVPSATYAAKQAGHFGSSANTSAGSDHRANFIERQQAGLFIGDSLRSRRMLLAALRQIFPQGNDHDGGPTTW